MIYQNGTPTSLSPNNSQQGSSQFHPHHSNRLPPPPPPPSLQQLHHPYQHQQQQQQQLYHHQNALQPQIPSNSIPQAYLRTQQPLQQLPLMQQQLQPAQAWQQTNAWWPAQGGAAAAAAQASMVQQSQYGVIPNSNNSAQSYGSGSESGSEDDDLDVGIGDVPSELEVKNSGLIPAQSKETERQLSKKEWKKKELAELDTVLAELGISGHAERKPDKQNGGDKNGAPVPSESKTSRKKKSKKTNQSRILKSSPMKWIPARTMERWRIQI
ncbi:hypothetical protein OsJ_05843 [Oryza sativa Japonica Group]|uniref:Uncharacterized protein n=1 Tax=Oryza sativa subsp. japonica TaxID=39947 RepID=B9F3Y5_ORYSJ|nr:hypothetical protein OsJ_05843 [Oryza sativa Japonica Group]